MERDINAMPVVLADERTLEALDFAAIREAVARHTASSRASVRARALVPGVDLAHVRAE